MTSGVIITAIVCVTLLGVVAIAAFMPKRNNLSDDAQPITLPPKGVDRDEL
ncbi:MAG: hypothetical protein FWE40_05350 [Oscillospiraceae bacterium]|nr:hypothetical protein [Oscillospiraceae bacterium]